MTASDIYYSTYWHTFKASNADMIKEFMDIVKPDHWEKGKSTDPETLRSVYFVKWRFEDPYDDTNAWSRWLIHEEEKKYKEQHPDG